ncbi:MAG: acetate--CoA ligase family protein [Candidatus Bathyarchaeota archaeon]
MKAVSEIFDKARNEGRKFLLEPEAKEICKFYEIPVTTFEVADSRKKAIEYAEKIGYPVVLKIVSPDIIHKSDVGGVIINVENQNDVEKAYNKIMSAVKTKKPRSRIKGILVQEMAPSSTEIIVGSIKDPQFGPTLMFGLGGIFVEVYKDTTFRIAPITIDEAKEMISEIKAYPLLKGYRGQPKADIDAIAKVLMKTSQLVMNHQEIKELDLNPIMVYENGLKTVDARIILE